MSGSQDVQPASGAAKTPTPSQHRTPESKASTLEQNTPDNWVPRFSTMPTESPNDSSDRKNALDTEKRVKEWLEHDQSVPVAWTPVTTTATQAESTHPSLRAARPEAMYRRVGKTWATQSSQRMELLHQMTSLDRYLDFLRDLVKHPMPIASAPKATNSPSEAAYSETERYTEARDAQKQSVASLKENLRDLNVEVNEASSAFDGWSTIAQSCSRWSYDGSNLLGQSTSSSRVSLSEEHEQVAGRVQATRYAAMQLRTKRESVNRLHGEGSEQMKHHLTVSFPVNGRTKGPNVKKKPPSSEPHTNPLMSDDLPYHLVDQNKILMDQNKILQNKLPLASPEFAKSRVLRETRLLASLNGHEVSAFPDVGAAANFIALRYVRSHGLTINSAARTLVKTAIGSAVDILGTITLPFVFRGEKKVHQVQFNVMREAVHDVIIGSPFLKLTKTFTRYKHRLQQMLREVRLPRLRFLESHQYVRGRVNGSCVDAVPDTGADVPVMSLSFAKEHGFEVITDPEHRILLQFADGSTATTIGMVRNMNWSFGSSGAQHHIDAYVLEELQTGLILDNTFLYDTNAFVAHERDFWTTNGGMFGDGWMISIIKLVDRVLKGSKLTNSGKYSGLACKLAYVYPS